MSATAYDVLLENGDLPEFCRLYTGLAIVMQRVDIRLKTLAGEWFLDTSVGIPWQEWTQIKPAPADLISGTLRREIEDTPGVTRLEGLKYTQDVQAQSITFTGTIVSGQESQAVSVTIGSQETGNTDPRYILFRRSGPIMTA